MEKLQGFTDHVMLYVKTLVKWLLAAALIGTVGGAVGSLFHLGVEYATELRTEVPALLYALPLTGVLIVALYRFLRTQGVGTNAVLDAVHQGRELPILLIPAIFLATLLTHLAGGSAGREGAALQIGGDLGEHFGKMLRMDDKDCRLATLCGMSALFSALFGTPLAAVFFALEVVSILFRPHSLHHLVAGGLRRIAALRHRADALRRCRTGDRCAHAGARGGARARLRAGEHPLL